ncbi:hypothetical protein WHR41_03139 [Cladosporium halotolerans]|uniref:DNA-directed RNA polymerase n=1 Tax=Cladosporium halotolerans TaxID=1052096 RepID=A0AB34KXD0_9PEZI
MLVRSAGRRQQRHTSRLLASSFAQLSLPWLAPAQLRWSATHSPASTQPSPRARRRSDSKASQQARAHVRHLATSTDQTISRQEHEYQPNGAPLNAFRSPAQDPNIPWDTKNPSEPSMANLRPYSDPVIINNTVKTADPLIKIQNGIVGTSMELLQHLYTTLRVGRMSRAENIIRRLAEQSPLNSPEVLHAHTAYLEELLRHLAASSTAERPKFQRKMQKWFEVEVNSNGIQPDAKILVVMVRAAIRGLQGSQRDRAIRRYAQMASKLGDETYDEVLSSEDYDDNEFTILGAATSEFYEEVEMEEPEVTETEEMDMTQLQRLDKIVIEDLPSVARTDQKGSGLDDIKKSLEAWTRLPALPSTASPEAQRLRAYERQRIMEETSVDIALERWRKEDNELRKLGISTAMQTKPLGALMWQWYSALLPVLEKELEECKKILASTTNVTGHSDRVTYAPYLELLPLRKVAANTILFSMTAMTKGKDRDTDIYCPDTKLASLVMGLGKAIEQECAIDAAKQARLNKARQRRKAKAAASPQNADHAMGKDHNTTTTPDSKPSRPQDVKAIKPFLSWPLDTKAKLGAMLISKLVETAQFPVTREHPRTREKVTQMQPAFLHTMKFTMGKRVGMVMPHPDLQKRLEHEPLGSLIAKRMPMIVEPRPWTSWSEGGYLQYPTPIMRIPIGDKSGKDYFMAAESKGDTKQIYAGLTALGRVPWKLNHHVLKVQIEAWNSGESIANFAPMNPTYEMPEEPEPSTDPGPRRIWLNEIRELENKKTGVHSQRCFQNFQLEIARAFANETLYFPHNMDFRGRAYPIPPYLNHMGADNARGLMMFGEGKELGEVGLRWLKIHLANVAGYDKASLQEREDFTMQHLDDIYDSVKNPLNGRRWWLESEDAWQTLAACYELTAALDSPDPTKYVSHLPTHQDGTCNGLQHYAALGGDKAGAAQVNLEPGDRPADIYTAVANAVKEEVECDAAAGDPVAKMLQGNISRKVVKQPVMTNVYGVTFFGARAQVKKQIVDIFPNLRSHGEVNPGNMSQYIATKIFKSLGSMFKGAQAIQVWLGTCADRISTSLSPEQVEQLTADVQTQVDMKAAGTKGKKVIQRRRDKMLAEQEIKAEKKATSSGGTSIEDKAHLTNAKPLFKSSVTWTTPLRIPVVQPYRSGSSRTVMTNMQKITLQEPQVWDPVSKRKQLQAFPPNFIHSLDATHMMLSALKCNEIGLTFASVHDSFWTHAGDIEKMSVVLRDAFVAMHSEDIIGRLREEFVTRYKDHMYLASVVANSEVGRKIIAFRKDTKSRVGETSEVGLERERMRLIASEDPAERAKGEAMVTPATIWLSGGDATAFTPSPDMGGQKLGELPEDADAVGVSPKDLDAAHDEVSAAEPNAAEDVVDEAGDAEAKSKSRVKGRTTSRSGKTYDRKLYVWLPLTFPEVPAKGDFDVKRLRQSKYFFH